MTKTTVPLTISPLVGGVSFGSDKSAGGISMGNGQCCFESRENKRRSTDRDTHAPRRDGDFPLPLYQPRTDAGESDVGSASVPQHTLSRFSSLPRSSPDAISLRQEVPGTPRSPKLTCFVCKDATATKVL